MPDQLYKVVEDQTNKTAYAGASRKNEKPTGVDRSVADMRANSLNREAAKMGLKTRYKVVEF